MFSIALFISCTQVTAPAEVVSLNGEPDGPHTSIEWKVWAYSTAAAALVLFGRPGPLSTMTWTIDLLTDRPETKDGWWLLQTRAENVAGGYSSQATTLWNADRQPVLVSRQNVAVFM